MSIINCVIFEKVLNTNLKKTIQLIFSGILGRGRGKNKEKTHEVGIFQIQAEKYLFFLCKQNNFSDNFLSDYALISNIKIQHVL